MATWTFRPQMPMSETLEWHTDTTRCYTSEQRECLRTMPRMYWHHEYQVDPQAYAIAVELCRANGGAAIDVPEWNSCTDNVPATTAGTVTLPVPNANQIPAYQPGKKALIWESNWAYEVVTLSGALANSISISATTQNHGKATVVPLRSCIFENNLEADRDASGDRDDPNPVVRCSAAFRCDVTEDLTPTYGVGIGYPDYLGSPVVTDQVVILSGARESVQRELATLDSETGLVDRRPIYASANRDGVLAWHCASRAELWNLRRWLHSRKGQQKNFWAPSWNADVVITRDITGGDTNIEIAAVGFASKWAVPVDMAIIAPDGGIWPIRVTGASSGGAGKELLALSSGFSGSVSVSAIEKTCKLTLSRFATDSIEINHLPGGQATVAVAITEDPNVPA